MFSSSVFVFQYEADSRLVSIELFAEGSVRRASWSFSLAPFGLLLPLWLMYERSPFLLDGPVKQRNYHNKCLRHVCCTHFISPGVLFAFR